MIALMQSVFFWSRQAFRCVIFVDNRLCLYLHQKAAFVAVSSCNFAEMCRGNFCWLHMQSGLFTCVRLLCNRITLVLAFLNDKNLLLNETVLT